MTTTLPTPLTSRQREILAWAAAYIADHGYSPTVLELRLAFQFTSPNGALCHLRSLRRKGLVEWQPGRSRTLRLTSLGEEVNRGG
jgi:repressor LexA